MVPHKSDVRLLTVRLRKDADFPGVDIISVRSYDIGSEAHLAHSADVASVDQALELIAAWLREPPATLP